MEVLRKRFSATANGTENTLILITDSLVSAAQLGATGSKKNRCLKVPKCILFVLEFLLQCCYILGMCAYFPEQDQRLQYSVELIKRYSDL